MNEPLPPFVGAVLCGGASRRMGHDKALLELDGRALARRVADALTEAGAWRVVAIGGDAAGLTRWGLDVVADAHPGEGPLGGVLTAFAHARSLAGAGRESSSATDRESSTTDIVAVLACDLIHPDSAAVAMVVAALAGAHVAVPVHDGHRHVHHAVWHRRAEPVVAAAFARGERAPRRVLDALTVVDVVLPDPEVLRDVDDPAAYARAQETTRHSSQQARRRR